MEFTPGSGPLIREELTPQQYAALSADMQAYADTHHVGDRWEIALTSVRDARLNRVPESVEVQSSECPDPLECDIAFVSLRVEAFVGFWETSAYASIESKRRIPTPTTLEQSITRYLHTDQQTDFVAVHGREDGSFDTCFDDHCYWLTDASTQDEPIQVTYFGIGIIPPGISIDPDKFFNTFLAYQESEVFDSDGGGGFWCLGTTVDTPLMTTSDFGGCPS
ncbi:MAG: hypothetical protein ACRDH8_09010 [Actinomycetota bacterium]